MMGESGLKLGCPVCGYGVDRTSWPGFIETKGGTFLIYFPLHLMMYEYLCYGCVRWATAAGAKWDGKLNLGFSGWRTASGSRL